MLDVKGQVRMEVQVQAQGEEEKREDEEDEEDGEDEEVSHVDGEDCLGVQREDRRGGDGGEAAPARGRQQGARAGLSARGSRRALGGPLACGARGGGLVAEHLPTSTSHLHDKR